MAHAKCKWHSNSRLFRSLSVAQRHIIFLSLLWKRSLHTVCVRASLGGTSGCTAFLYMKGLFVIPKSKNRRQLKKEIDRTAWNMQVVCQQTRSACLQFIDCCCCWPFAQTLNTFFVVQWTQMAIPAKVFNQSNRSTICKIRNRGTALLKKAFATLTYHNICD